MCWQRGLAAVTQQTSAAQLRVITHQRTWERSTSRVKPFSNNGSSGGIVSGFWYLRAMLAAVCWRAARPEDNECCCCIDEKQNSHFAEAPPIRSSGGQQKSNITRSHTLVMVLVPRTWVALFNLPAPQQPYRSCQQTRFAGRCRPPALHDGLCTNRQHLQLQAPTPASPTNGFPRHACGARCWPWRHWT